MGSAYGTRHGGTELRGVLRQRHLGNAGVDIKSYGDAMFWHAGLRRD